MPALLMQTSQQLLAALVATRELLVRQMRRRMRNPGDAEDIAHDSLVAALSNLHAYRGDAKLATWMYRIGANAALMTARSQRRAAARTARAASLLNEEMNWLRGSTFGGLQQRLEQSSNALLIGRALEELPRHYRAVITQHDLDEKPIAMVATRLGLTPAGVRTRRLRALSLLRDWLRLHGYTVDG